MAKVKVYDGETLVKELDINIDLNEIQARLEAQPYSLNLDVNGHPFVLEVLIHPSMVKTVESLFAKARKKNEDEGEEEQEEQDERFKRLMAILDEAIEEMETSEDEEEEEEEEETQKEMKEAIKELTKAVKSLRDRIEELKAGKEEQVAKESRRTPVVIKSWAPYERVQKFEQAPSEMKKETAHETEGLSEFQKELLKRLNLPL